ncbi:unnamed protein product [Chrysoparadoxa australica]
MGAKTSRDLASKASKAQKAAPKVPQAPSVGAQARQKESSSNLAAALATRKAKREPPMQQKRQPPYDGWNMEVLRDMERMPFFERVARADHVLPPDIPKQPDGANNDAGGASSSSRRALPSNKKQARINPDVLASERGMLTQVQMEALLDFAGEADEMRVAQMADKYGIDEAVMKDILAHSRLPSFAEPFAWLGPDGERYGIWR